MVTHPEPSVTTNGPLPSQGPAPRPGAASASAPIPTPTGTKWGTIATAALLGIGGWLWKGPVAGLIGGIGGWLLGGLLDGFFQKLGWNPITPMPAYPTGVVPLQPTVDLPAPVTQQGQAPHSSTVVRSILLENLRVPTVSLPATQQMRTEIANILHSHNGTDRLPGLQRELHEAEHTIMQFNMTFEEYLRKREEYHRQGGERERLVDAVASATHGTASPFDRATAEAFVPTLPAMGTDLCGKKVGYVKKSSPYEGWWCQEFLDKVDTGDDELAPPEVRALYEVELAKGKRGEPSRIYTHIEYWKYLASHGNSPPVTDGYYFIDINTTHRQDIIAYKPCSYDVARRHEALLQMDPNLDIYGRSVFLSKPGNTSEMWNAMTTHEKCNVILTYVEAERGRYERGGYGSQTISWGSLPAPAGVPSNWDQFMRVLSTGGSMINTDNYTEEECVRDIKAYMQPPGGGAPSTYGAAGLRQLAFRARALAVGRGATAAVAEYDKILRYCDLLDKHVAVLAKLAQLEPVSRWRGHFRDSVLVPAEAETHDFVQHRLPVFNQTKIAIMSHGQQTPAGVGRGHFITFRDANQANTQTVTVFATRQADGSYKITHAWQGEWSDIALASGRLAAPVDLDRSVVEALESRDGRVNATELAQSLRRVQVGQLASRSLAVSARGLPAAAATSGPGGRNRSAPDEPAANRQAPVPPAAAQNQAAIGFDVAQAALSTVVPCVPCVPFMALPRVAQPALK